MRHLSIRIKLALLAGVPVLGVLALAVLIASGAKRSAETAAALGSVEQLAVLADGIGRLVHELQTERASLARQLEGTGARARDPALSAQLATTDRARDVVLGFLRERDVKSLPGRFARAIEVWRAAHGRLTAVRARAQTGAIAAGEMMTAYGEAIHALVGATAGLAELTQDGEILRYVNASVAMLEQKERASQQHAWLCHVLTIGEFPPGVYKTSVTLVSEEQTYDAVFRLAAPQGVLARPSAKPSRTEYARADNLRDEILSAIEHEFTVTPEAWFEAQRAKLSLLYELQRALVSGVHEAAVAKIAESRRAALLGGSMAGAVLTFSVVLAFIITRGILRSVRTLQVAVQKVGQGDLDARFTLSVNDELGQLGGAFNLMVDELKQSRTALSEQAMMRRELEIASTIQQALLPPTPNHPDFEFAGRMSPADEVGGDFYDVLTDADGDKLWITVGDVSGHGLGAGLVMLMAQSAFGAYFRANAAARPGDVLTGVNNLLCEQITHRLRDDKYVTAQLWMYEGDGNFCVAGAHVWPIVYRADTRRCETIEITGPWLGIVDELQDIPVSHVHLEPDDVLCLYSDGLTEARDERGELFDQERMMNLVTTLATKHDLTRAADELISGVSSYAAKHEDDWTLLLVRRRSGSSVDRLRPSH
jgi:serine phosphatase RsbU (regulator of sigma subunit)